MLGAAGLVLWGVGAAKGLHWIGPVVGLGMLAFSVICGGSITLSYAVDCFKVKSSLSHNFDQEADVRQEISGETMMSVVVIRNTLGFAINYAINPWIDGMGLQNCFVTVAMVAFGCTATFLPMIWFGKRMRRASAEKYWEYVVSAGTTHT